MISSDEGIGIPSSDAAHPKRELNICLERGRE